VHHVTKYALPALLAGGLMLSAAPSQAATRNYIVTDFDTVRLEAPIAVGVQTRRGVTARGDGDADLLERIELNVQARVLTIRLKPSPFEARKSDQGLKARLLLTTQLLRRAHLAGSGTLAVDGMGGQNAEIFSTGSGALTATRVDSDVLAIAQQGSGSLTLAGKARKATIQLSGSGALDASALTVSDLDVTAEGGGAVKALATRSAKVTTIGPATVAVDGHPACTVRHAGSGAVRCAGEDY
jgi:hypothetical protein